MNYKRIAIKEFQAELKKLNTNTYTKEQLKKVYHKLARKYHPDVTNNSKEAEEKFKIITEIYEKLNDKKLNEKDLFKLCINEFMQFDIDKELKRKTKELNNRFNIIVANIQANMQVIDTSDLYVTLGEVHKKLQNKDPDVDAIEQELNILINNIERGYGFNIEKDRIFTKKKGSNSNTNAEEDAKIANIYTTLKRQHKHFMAEIKNLEIRINNFETINLSDIKNRYNQARILFVQSFNQNNKNTQKWIDLKEKCQQLLAEMQTSINILERKQKNNNKLNNIKKRIDYIINQMDDASYALIDNTDYNRLRIAIYQLRNNLSNYSLSNIEHNLTNIINEIKTKLNFDVESQKSYKQQMEQRKNSTENINLAYKKLQTIWNNFNTLASNYEKEIQQNKTVDISKLEKLKDEFEKIVIKIDPNLRSNHKYDKLFEYIDNHLKQMTTDISDFKKANQNINKRKGQGSNNILNMLNIAINNLRINQADIIQNFPNKKSEIELSIQNLEKIREEFINKLQPENSVTQFLQTMHTKFLNEYKYDFFSKETYNEQKTKNDIKQSEYDKLITEIQDYLNLLDDNESLILHGSNSKKNSNYEKNFKNYKQQLSKIIEAAKNQTDTVDNLRKEANKILDAINDEYKFDARKKKENNPNKHKVVSVRRIGWGLGGIAVGRLGIIRLINTTKIAFMLGFNFIPLPEILVTIGLIIFSLSALKKAAKPDEENIISKCIEKLKEIKQELQSELEEENLEQDEEEVKNGGRRR